MNKLRQEHLKEEIKQKKRIIERDQDELCRNFIIIEVKSIIFYLNYFLIHFVFNKK